MSELRTKEEIVDSVDGVFMDNEIRRRTLDVLIDIRDILYSRENKLDGGKCPQCGEIITVMTFSDHTCKCGYRRLEKFVCPNKVEAPRCAECYYGEIKEGDLVDYCAKYEEPTIALYTCSSYRCKNE